MILKIRLVSNWDCGSDKKRGAKLPVALVLIPAVLVYAQLTATPSVQKRLCMPTTPTSRSIARTFVVRAHHHPPGCSTSVRAQPHQPSLIIPLSYERAPHAVSPAILLSRPPLPTQPSHQCSNTPLVLVLSCLQSVVRSLNQHRTTHVRRLRTSGASASFADGSSMFMRAHPSTFTVGTLPNEEGFIDDAFSGPVRQRARVLGFSRNDDGCIFITFSVCFG